MMLMQLEIIEEGKEPRYPMGEVMEFETLKDFIAFNIEWMEMLVADAPEYATVMRKLLTNEFIFYTSDDINDIVTVCVYF